jgi:hypothetical protein
MGVVPLAYHLIDLTHEASLVICHHFDIGEPAGMAGDALTGVQLGVMADDIIADDDLDSPCS